MEEEMKCRECRAADLNETQENYRYTESGLPNVVLVGVTIRRCPNCGAQMLVLPRIEELHESLAFAVAAHRGRLSGAEIRYLRKYLGWDQESFARVMGVTTTSVSRWENEKEPIGPTSERLLRLL